MNDSIDGMIHSTCEESIGRTSVATPEGEEAILFIRTGYVTKSMGQTSGMSSRATSMTSSCHVAETRLMRRADVCRGELPELVPQILVFLAALPGALNSFIITLEVNKALQGSPAEVGGEAAQVVPFLIQALAAARPASSNCI